MSQFWDYTGPSSWTTALPSPDEESIHFSDWLKSPTTTNGSPEHVLSPEPTARFPHEPSVATNTLDHNPSSGLGAGRFAPKRAKKAPTLNAAVWKIHKDRVLQLHIQEGRPLAEVREIVEQQYGFTATQWKEGKNVKRKEMQAIVRKHHHRQTIETNKLPLEFMVRDKRIDDKQIDRWRKRNETYEHLTSNTSSPASTPSAVMCRTISVRSDLTSSPQLQQHVLPTQPTMSLPTPIQYSYNFQLPNLPGAVHSQTVLSGPFPSLEHPVPRIPTTMPSPSISCVIDERQAMQTLTLPCRCVRYELSPLNELVLALGGSSGWTSSKLWTAEGLCLRVLEQFRIFGNYDSERRVVWLLMLTAILASQSKLKSAATKARDCIALRQSPVTNWSRFGRIYMPIAMLLLGGVYYRGGRMTAAVHTLRTASKMMESGVVEQDQSVKICVMQMLAQCYVHQCKLIEAEQMYSVLSEMCESLGERFPHVTLQVFVGMAGLHWRTGRLAKAKQALESLISLRQNFQHSCLNDIEMVVESFTEVCLKFGKLDKAEQLAKFISAAHHHQPGELCADTVPLAIGLGYAYVLQKRYAEAEIILSPATKLVERYWGAQHYYSFNSRYTLVWLHRDAGRQDEAITLGKDSLARFTSAYGPEHELSISAMLMLATTYRTFDRLDEMVGLLESYVDALQNIPWYRYSCLAQAVRMLTKVYEPTGRREDIVRLEKLLFQCRENLEDRLTSGTMADLEAEVAIDQDLKTLMDFVDNLDGTADLDHPIE